jgi:uncharacterized C2H2 Zn-finger protein
MNDGTVVLTHAQLQELIGIARSAVGMMEPYYSQCGAGDEIERDLEPFEDMLPYVETIHRKAITECPVCSRKFRHAKATGDHMRDMHQWGRGRVQKEIIEASEPIYREWESGAAFKAYVASTWAEHGETA